MKKKKKMNKKINLLKKLRLLNHINLIIGELGLKNNLTKIIN